MPSSIFFNGQRIYRAGTYVRVNDTLSAISDLTGGNIALIGDFPIFKQAEIQTFSSFETFDATIDPEGLRGGIYEDVDYKAIANVAFDSLFNPSQQIDSFSVINTRGTTQASITNNGLTVKSKFYGRQGNNISYELKPSLPLESGLWDIEIKNTGNADLVEVMRNIGDGEAAKVTYTYDVDNGKFDYGSVKAQVTETHLEIESTMTINHGDAGFLAHDLVSIDGDYRKLDFGGVSIEGTIKVKCLANQAAATNDVLIKGYTVGGVLTEETLTLHNTNPNSIEQNMIFTTANEYVTLEYIKFKDTINGNVQVNWNPKKTLLTDILDLEAWLSDLSNRSADFTFVAPSTVISGADLDRDSATTTISGGLNYIFTTDTARIVEHAFAASLWVDAEATSNEPPVATNSLVSLIGGGNDASTAVSSVKTALANILHQNVNIIVPASDDIEILKLVRDHCDEASTKSGLERNAWLGAKADQTLAYTHNIYVKELNNRNCSIVCQGLKLTKEPNKSFTTPWMTALACASVQASTPISEPMTRKVVNGIEPLQTQFDPDLDANTAIRLSIVLLNNARGPIRIERSVTTYRKKLDHPVYTEVSANESINTCVRTLRDALDIFVGVKATQDRAGEIAETAKKHLDKLRDRAIISNHRNVKVLLSGDVLNIVFDVAAIEPLNFITVQANLGQF